MNFSLKDNSKIPKKSILLIFLAVALLIITYSIIELIQSKKEMYLLMREQSHSLLETTLTASHSALLSYEVIDKEMKSRLLNNANLVKILFEKKLVTNNLLKNIADDNFIYRINILGNDGQKLFSSHEQTHSNLEEKYNPRDVLYPIFQGLTDTLFLGVKEARFEEGYRYTIAIASLNRSAIVLNLDAADILNFRKEIGFGILLKNVTKNNGIIYAALQDTSNILAASGDVNLLEDLNESQFLTEALHSNMFTSRIATLDSIEVFEAVHPFIYKDNLIGLLRLGLSTDPLNSLTQKSTTRLIILGIILLILGSILLSYVFVKQNFNLLKKDYKIIEAYSEQVINNVSDSVIVLDDENKIKLFNASASKLLNTDFTSVEGQPITSILNYDLIKDNESMMDSIEFVISGSKKHLLVSQSSFSSNNNKINTILVIRDLTKQKQIEAQMHRKERLIAMGELASGVAHEIRNPLNTISTITQQLKKDFQPKSDEEEYHTLSSLVANEVKRINDTVNSFLRFSKPEKIVLNEFLLSDLLTQIKNQYSAMLHDKSVSIDIKMNWDGNVNWDKNQIQQAIMNLVQNSFDSIEGSGEILIQVDGYDCNQIILTVSDNGCGIPEHIKNRIFNLYYTTKAKGTGIGLSIVQKIIMEHAGTISVESEEGKGSMFSIILPINLEL